MPDLRREFLLCNGGNKRSLNLVTDHLIACPAMKHLENSISQPCDTEGEIPELLTLIVTVDKHLGLLPDGLAISNIFECQPVAKTSDDK